MDSGNLTPSAFKVNALPQSYLPEALFLLFLRNLHIVFITDILIYMKFRNKT